MANNIKEDSAESLDLTEDDDYDDIIQYASHGGMHPNNSSITSSMQCTKGNSPPYQIAQSQSGASHSANTSMAASDFNVLPITAGGPHPLFAMNMKMAPDPELPEEDDQVPSLPHMKHAAADKQTSRHKSSSKFSQSNMHKRKKKRSSLVESTNSLYGINTDLIINSNLVQPNQPGTPQKKHKRNLNKHGQKIQKSQSAKSVFATKKKKKNYKTRANATSPTSPKQIVIQHKTSPSLPPVPPKPAALPSHTKGGSVESLPPIPTTDNAALFTVNEEKSHDKHDQDSSMFVNSPDSSRLIKFNQSESRLVNSDNASPVHSRANSMRANHPSSERIVHGTYASEGQQRMISMSRVTSNNTSNGSAFYQKLGLRNMTSMSVDGYKETEQAGDYEDGEEYDIGGIQSNDISSESDENEKVRKVKQKRKKKKRKNAKFEGSDAGDSERKNDENDIDGEKRVRNTGSVHDENTIGLSLKKVKSGNDGHVTKQMSYNMAADEFEVMSSPSVVNGDQFQYHNTKR